ADPSMGVDASPVALASGAGEQATAPAPSDSPPDDGGPPDAGAPVHADSPAGVDGDDDMPQSIDVSRLSNGGADARIRARGLRAHV
ncbi:MAG TPA: hypothetical protein VF065_03035, partial [Ilumatobacter sp.]